MQITGKASIKSDIDKIAFIQNHPNGQNVNQFKLNTFSEFISNNTHFHGVITKQ